MERSDHLEPAKSWSSDKTFYLRVRDVRDRYFSSFFRWMDVYLVE